MSRRVLLRFSLLIVAASSILLAGSGCTQHDPADSNIPWGRPAAWEDRVPGMGNY